MSNYLDPIAATEQPRQDFLRYLLTAYPLRDPHLRYGLRQQLEQPGNVWQHPYLEGSQPYRPASSIKDLVNQGVLHYNMSCLFTPSDRSLYEHQERAVRAVVEQQENIIVATGTGSGKTECFLIPMLDMLLKEGANTLGVRALILYPMNALVNDQVKRLRKLLCCQAQPKIRFGFYTSRTETEPKKAEQSLTEEFQAYDSQELLELFPEGEREFLRQKRHEELVGRAVEETKNIQAISRQEIWDNPPHILITNYSMLEHMLIRPTERTKIFEASAATFKMLVVDEAHSYNGSTGTEVSMLLKRLKTAVKVEEPGRIRCIATSASLGNASVDGRVLQFAKEFFGESFTQVIRGDRVTAIERLGKHYIISCTSEEWVAPTEQEVLEYLSILELPASDDLNQWFNELSYIVPPPQLQQAQSKAGEDVHKFLWFALKQHPLVHRLINLLSNKPQPWEQVAQSTQLWGVNLPLNLDGSVDDTDANQALAHLLQLGTLARENPEDLPLLPVRLHLLFRSLEGLYACINPDCCGALRDPNHQGRPRYGQLYLNEKTTCDACASPVLELGSCSQCGQAYALTTLLNDSSKELQSLPRATQALRDNPKIYTLTSGLLDSVTEEEEVGEVEEEQESKKPSTFTIRHRDGWIGVPSAEPFTPKATVQGEFYLAWHRQKDDLELKGCYLPKCAACGARPIRAQAINRFVSYTDAPLQVMIDSLFNLLPELQQTQSKASKRKLLTFSDGRQDAAFFASDYQRNHTETLYRQMVWQAFQEVKNADGVASVKQVTDQLKEKFLEIPIPHPERESKDNYLSYVPGDEQGLENDLDCQKSADSRAKELLLREFAIPFARRSSLEGLTVLACHIQEDSQLVEWVAERFNLTSDEARIFLIGLTDIIRRTGIVSIEGASRYFPETGGVEGVRPEMVDAQGRSKNYLFLEKSPEETKKYQDSPSFLPKWKQSGEVSQAQNRLGWYYFKLFGEQFPKKEDFIWLYEQMKSSRLLVPAQKGFHLNWKRLNIIETQQDWYRCDRCKHFTHVPGLSEISQLTINVNVFGCPTFKCSGTLQPYTPEKIERAANEHHQQYLIKKSSPLPLRSQEHTAQLGVGELEKRENRFRRGQINLLSCSTTLEMGVDIGELQAVVLRNFPPHVSNYQQRAGRAGRRTDGVAITLMYGQRRPHDRFYFEQPEQLIAGSNQIPKLDLDNFQIQQRHIRAELLAAFLNTDGDVGAEKVAIADLFDLPQPDSGASSDFSPPATAMVCRLQECRHGDQALSIAQSWLDRLQSSGTAQDVLNQFRESISVFQQDQLEDWNGLVSLLKEIQAEIDAARTDRKKRDSLEKRRNGVEAELDKIAGRQLHEQLVHASVLPIYGFPIDVVRLLTSESNDRKSSQGRHRLERDRRLALGEYAPDQEIVVDDRVYKSVGILRPKDLEENFYWVCKNCNNFLRSKQQEVVVECPVCESEPTSAAAKKMKAYKVPKAFMTDWTELPLVTPYTKPMRQPTSQVFLANEGENPEKSHESGLYRLTVSQGGTFFLANQGALGNGKGFSNQGFAICQSCGRDLSDEVRKGWETNNKKGRGKKSSASSKSSRPTHNHPITGKQCSGWYPPPPIHLGHEFRSDLLKIEFDAVTKPILLFDDRTVSSIANNPDQVNSGLKFWRSLTYAMLAAAAQVIDVRREELDGLFTPLADRRAEIILYDNVPGGAGYSRRIAERFQEILSKAYELVALCNCDSSCYDCLRTYSNQPFHAELNRCVVAEFLRPLVEQVKPDPELQNFAPNANRVSLSQMATRLPALCRMVSPLSIIYLPTLTDAFAR